MLSNRNFSYKVDMGEIEKIKTVGDIIEILETRTALIRLR